MSFIIATLVSFGVYFLTLGPSIGLEDAGELVVAADHAGVPHSPGYPLWTMLNWLMCRLFGWVTYRGMPNPAWCVALGSAVMGAIAAGITAMLITRSGRDFAQDLAGDDDEESPCVQRVSLWVGVGASLAFAFSPVMWSQAVIVEVYALGALFMMWVMLLAYRWLRSPSDKVLWLLAFVFGLGLTNYQVLLLAALPLMLIILIRDLKLFRDFILAALPLGLGVYFLSVGALPSASEYSTQGAPVILRFALPTETVALAHPYMLWVGLGLMAAGFLGFFWREHVMRCEKPCPFCHGCLKLLNQPLGWPFISVAFIGGIVTWMASLYGDNVPIEALPFVSDIPLIAPIYYTALTATMGVLIVLLMALAGRLNRALPLREQLTHEVRILLTLIVGGVMVLCGVMMALPIATQLPVNFQGTFYPLGQLWMVVILTLTIMVALSWGKIRSLIYTATAAVVIIPVLVLLQNGALLGLEDPNTWWFAWPIIWNIVLLIQMYICLERGRAVAATIFLAELGVSVYIYMPIVSDLLNPAMNWGYPRTWEGFKHTLSRGQYEQLQPVNIFSLRFIQQVGAYLSEVRMQFTLLLAPLAILPFTQWRWGKRSMLSVAIGLYAICSVFVIGADLLGMESLWRIDKVILLAMLLLGLIGIGRYALCALPERYAHPRLRSWQAQVTIRRISAIWLLSTVLFFLVMSVMLIALANPKGDLQDSFIQKVKFISSHGIIAVWIGYGLLCALLHLRSWRRMRYLTGMTIVLAIGMAFIPLWENATNDRLILAMGAAEQNGHDFGWQFGNYQLRGAEAIREELTIDEEPLPDPFYPPALEQDAILLGGSDPGRFVPTYMIYSANVRPDVYILTQNALADVTYMHVERDHYGDHIWIPSSDDITNSFNQFLSEVESGQRRSAGVSYINGRAKIVGPSSIMEINELLCLDFVTMNQANHAFYVEDSYPISWMRDRLEPHGLIMHLHPTKIEISEKRIQQDRDFWDWYTRRLVTTPAYRRDFAAQKSFSKLRTSIASLYSRTPHLNQAYKQALQDAIVLYPVNPEAIFKYTLDVLLPAKDYTRTLALLQGYAVLDPNNIRLKRVLDVALTLKQRKARLDAILQIKAMRTLTLDEKLEQAGLFVDLEQLPEAIAIWDELTDEPQLTIAQCIRGVQSLIDLDAQDVTWRLFTRIPYEYYEQIPESYLAHLAGLALTKDDLARALTGALQVLKYNPRNWRVKLIVALTALSDGEEEEAFNLFNQLLEDGGSEAVLAIEADQQLFDLYRSLYHKFGQTPPMKESH